MMNRSTKQQVKSRKTAWLAVAALLVLSMLCFWLWYDRYLRIDFNELGRFYDAQEGVVYTDSAFVWVLPAVAFLLAAIVQAVRAIRWHALNEATHNPPPFD